MNFRQFLLNCNPFWGCGDFLDSIGQSRSLWIGCLLVICWKWSQISTIPWIIQWVASVPMKTANFKPEIVVFWSKFEKVVIGVPVFQRTTFIILCYCYFPLCINEIPGTFCFYLDFYGEARLKLKYPRYRENKRFHSRISLSMTAEVILWKNLWGIEIIAHVDFS